jgi:hypothetical protein
MSGWFAPRSSPVLQGQCGFDELGVVLSSRAVWSRTEPTGPRRGPADGVVDDQRVEGLRAGPITYVQMRTGRASLEAGSKFGDELVG